MSARDQELAQRAKEHGARYSLRIIREARRAGIPISLGFALIEQESNFTNVFGHDPTIFAGAGTVTKAKYAAYRKQRGRTRMQGVGPAQLTWWEYQDRADERGGCWIARHNIAVGFDILAAHIKAKGTRAGIAAYNGTGAKANRYATQVLDKQDKWHRRLV